ncbi:MAG: type II secretion system protein [Eubacterium sp.]|nr:type II secretion system protein [Eubacterium sp.]MBR1674998.1 type II secretion system protein [Eubacterium sp.]
MKKTISKNKGFSLVEMIIVLAIVAVMSTMALISINVIRSAKAKDAATVFDSEVATLKTKAKGMGVDANKDGSLSDEELKLFYCIKIYKEGDTYYLCTGYTKAESVSTNFVSTATNNGGKGRNLSTYVKIKYTGKLSDGTAVTDQEPGDGDDAFYIVFNKRGECVYGVGEYEFFKPSGRTVARKYIRANGSHGSK